MKTVNYQGFSNDLHEIREYHSNQISYYTKLIHENKQRIDELIKMNKEYNLNIESENNICNEITNIINLLEKNTKNEGEMEMFQGVLEPNIIYNRIIYPFYHHNKKIDAIKKLRDFYILHNNKRIDLKSAKDYVDRFWDSDIRINYIYNNI